MSQTIDPARLRAAAERLEQAFVQHSGADIIQRLHRSLESLMEDAKSFKLVEPVIRLPTPRFSPAEAWPTEGGKELDQAFLNFFLEVRGIPAQQSAGEEDEMTLREQVRYVLDFAEEDTHQLFREAEQFLKETHCPTDKAYGDDLSQRLLNKAIDLSSSRATEMSPHIPELMRVASRIAFVVKGAPPPSGPVL